MSGVRDACKECLRRAWLLQQLDARLGYQAADPERLLRALTLGDADLIRALAGRHREQLLKRHALFEPRQLPAATGTQRICRHDPHYPAALRGAWAPHMLHVLGSVERMQALLRQPAVALVGARRASDYGMEVAYGLGRGLAASGVTVVSGLADGIAAASHQGALHGGGATITVMAGGVDVPSSASWRELHRRVAAEACVLAELPCGSTPRGWWHPVRARIVTALTQLVIVVEATERPTELVHARLAQTVGVPIAAVPGRVSAPAARGPHMLLREGALLVRDAQDVLDAMYGVGEREVIASRPAPTGRLRAVLDQVGVGEDTAAKLTAGEGHARISANETLIALAELECSGAIARGDGGRYVRCV